MRGAGFEALSAGAQDLSMTEPSKRAMADANAPGAPISLAAPRSSSRWKISRPRSWSAPQRDD